MINPFKQKTKDETEEIAMYDDRLIVFESDSNVCEIYTDVTVDAESVTGHGDRVKKIHKADCTIRVSEMGRVWLYNAPTAHVQTTEHLAELEKSIVLKQVTMFKPEAEFNHNLDMKFWAVVGIAIVLAFVSIF